MTQEAQLVEGLDAYFITITAHTSALRLLDNVQTGSLVSMVHQFGSGNRESLACIFVRLHRQLETPWSAAVKPERPSLCSSRLAEASRSWEHMMTVAVGGVDVGAWAAGMIAR